ncbi:hypothetical protein O6H91_14G002400 [Diphasiastrum complanatum]|uniref:Uncharacterized protein n=1 Tax=Diphasiastrum complanatum TaxID=34168 RepID=A0ACC2BKU8_DIPCM|nr:hypothetical protein O6H91_14G002400 [Diphasiastrum complanatum]
MAAMLCCSSRASALLLNTSFGISFSTACSSPFWLSSSALRWGSRQQPQQVPGRLTLQRHSPAVSGGALSQYSRMAAAEEEVSSSDPAGLRLWLEGRASTQDSAAQSLFAFNPESAVQLESQGLDYDELQGSKLARPDLAESSRSTTNAFNIVFVSSEVAPYSKSGGLGDVCGSLPVALASRGHRVMVVSPRYWSGPGDTRYAGAYDAQARIKVSCFDGENEVAFFHEYRAGVDWVFVDHPSYHRPGTPYGDTRGTFGDNQFRFTLLCHAACEAPLVLPLGGYTYGEKCVFIANDWHAGLIPITGCCSILAAKYRKHGVHRDSRCILAIHNLSHQGVEPATTFGSLGLPSDWYGALEWVFPNWARKHALDKGEAVNHLKGAVVTADRILTVSQGYAWEITTQEGGFGLDGLLRSRNSVINGITNGVDVDQWNPATDKYIASQYTPEDSSGKTDCKAALQKELGLSVRPDVPLIGFIGRLDYQKGPDVIQAALPELLTDDVQMVMLGSGEPSIESWMSWAESNYKDKFRGWVGFSEAIAHQITAGCDILLMPSRFEPCGLNQLYAMRYGTVPVVHSTGGLRDTVEDFNPFANGGQGVGTGWTFSPLSKEPLMQTLWTAIATYRHHKSAWMGIMKRGMSRDFSWDRAALQYERVFEWAMIDPPYV